DMWLPRAVRIWTAGPNPARTEEWRAPESWATVLSEYANFDSSHTLLLWIRMEGELAKRKLSKIFDARMKVLRPTHLIESGGVTGNLKDLRTLRDDFRGSSAELGGRCLEIASSRGFDLALPKGGRNKSLDEFVFDVLGLEKVHDPQGKVAGP